MLKTTVIAVTILFATAIISREQTTHPSSVGRFQLFQGRHEYHDSQKNTTLTVEEVFRIDTATGSTVVYDEGVKRNGDYFSRWNTPITEQ